jgi:hypothetical protein
MPKLARVKAAARDVVQRTNGSLMGVCTPIIELEDAVIVLEKVAGDHAGKGILHIRIDVDLHCVVIQVFQFSLQALHRTPLTIAGQIPTSTRIRLHPLSLEEMQTTKLGASRTAEPRRWREVQAKTSTGQQDCLSDAEIIVEIL